MYYEKEAISKQLYDWLLKNGYADANLIAKWKKQGYEKVRIIVCDWGIKLMGNSYAACGASKPKRPISARRVSAGFPRHNSRKTR